MRNDTENGRAKGTLDIVNRFHASVQILDKECESHTQNQADHNPKRDIQWDIGPHGPDGQIRIVDDFHGGFLRQFKIHLLLHDPQQDGVTNAGGVCKFPLGVKIFTSLFTHV